MGKTITQEIAAIVDAQGGSIEGYPTTIAGTLDALADTLAGSDVETGRSIADSVRAVGEHIGGGGGASLGNMAVLNTQDFSGGEIAICYIGTAQCVSLVPGNSSLIAGGVNVEIFDEGISELGTVSAVTIVDANPGEDLQEVPFTDFTAVIDEDWECLKISFTMPNIAKNSQGSVGLIRFTYSGK